MKKILIILACILAILFSTSCSNNFNSIYLLAPEETKIHFENYISDLNGYGKIDAEWYGRDGSIYIYPDYSDALLIFDLYNQAPDQISSFSEETDVPSLSILFIKLLKQYVSKFSPKRDLELKNVVPSAFKNLPVIGS